MENLIVSHTERFVADIPVRIWINPEYEHLGYYEQIGGQGFGDYWGELTYCSTSYNKDTLEEDLKKEEEEI